MKINVTENKVSIKEKQILNENEYNIHRIQFDFSSEYTDDLVKVALFSIDNHTYKKIISNNECDIPPEVLTQRGYSILGVYAYKTEQDTLVLRYSPSPTRIYVYNGSYKADAENSEPITPSEIEQYQQILQNSLQQFQNQYNALVEETEGDIQAIENELQRKVDEGYFDGEDGFSPIAKVIQKSNGATIEIEDKNGKTTADVLNGADGKDGKDGQDGQDGKDGIDGKDGKDAKINGKNSIEIEAGNNITIDNTGNGIRINSTGGGSGGTSNYNDLSNKPKINNVELSGNKSLNDLGIQPVGDYALESDIPDVSNFITNSVNNLLNYYLKSETYTKQEVNNLIGQIATLQFQVVSTLPQTGDSKYIYLVPSSNPKTQNVKDEYIWVNNSWEQIGSTQIDLTGYATENWVNTQISGFLTQTQIQALINTALSEYTETDPTVPSHVKNITQANITSWNNKSDFSGNYNDLTNKPTIPVVPTNVSAFTNDVGYLTQHQDISGKANKISVVQTSASTIEINPNTFYKFGEVASLNITLASITDNTIYNEYMFEFVSGSTATTLTLPSSIKWLETPTIDANKIYQCSIVDNIGVLLGVANV